MGKEILSKKAIIFGIILLFIGASVIPLIGSSENAGGGWWNENWSYSRVLPITNPSNSYQMKIIVGKSQGGEVNCNGHCKNDFSDIRFVDVDNTTQLPYWMENYSNGNQATFWVKLPSDVESYSKIVMYYGNTNASSMSNGPATFLWFDDFQTNSIGDWTKVEDFQQHGWIFYNNNYHSSMNSGRLRSNVDCVDITAEAWPTIGEISQGFKGENDNMLWANTTQLSYSSRSEEGATDNQPISSLASTNASGSNNTANENVMWKGTNGYITELLYSYPNNYVGGKIWDSSAHLLWNTAISSYIPEHMTYLFWYLKDMHNQIGYNGAGLYYDAVQKKLIVCCNSTDPNAPWLQLRYNWMFLASYTEPEPTISASGHEIKTQLFYPTDDTVVNEVKPNSTSGSLEYMWVRNGSGADSNKYQWDGLIKFNVSSIPSNTIIKSATLNLYYYTWNDNNPAGRNLNLTRATSDWNEETVTWNNQPSYAPQPTTYSTVPSSYDWMNWNVKNDIQNFVNGQVINFGWKIADQKHWGMANIPMTCFRTKEYGNYIPYLEVEYTPGEINTPPTAEAGGPYSAQVNTPITFSGAGSNDPDGTITGYRWDFNNDGTYDTGWLTSPTTTHSYANPGTYTITLQVKDNDNATDTDTATATITTTPPPQNIPPTAKAGGPYTGYENYGIIFDGSGSTDSDGSITGYRWDWNNDGIFDTGWLTTSSTTHAYSTSGTYTAKLQVKDNDNALGNDTAIVTVRPLNGKQPPKADAGGPYQGNTNVSITFDGSGSSDADGTITSYLWIFGDGSTGTGVSPSHTYTTAGSYIVNLTVTDNDGITVSNTTTATINESKKARLILTTSASNIELYEENNEKTITLTIYCYDNSVDNVHLEVLNVSNLTITQLSPNLSLRPGEHADLIVNIQTPKMREGVKMMNESVSLQVVGDNGTTSNVEQINFKVIPKNTPGFETIATIAAVGSAGALVTFFRRRNGNR